MLGQFVPLFLAENLRQANLDTAETHIYFQFAELYAEMRSVVDVVYCLQFVHDNHLEGTFDTLRTLEYRWAFGITIW